MIRPFNRNEINPNFDHLFYCISRRLKNVLFEFIAYNDNQLYIAENHYEQMILQNKILKSNITF